MTVFEEEKNCFFLQYIYIYIYSKKVSVNNVKERKKKKI